MKPKTVAEMAGPHVCHLDSEGTPSDRGVKTALEKMLAHFSTHSSTSLQQQSGVHQCVTCPSVQFPLNMVSKALMTSKVSPRRSV